MRKDSINARQQAIYDYIVQFYNQHSYPPTVREIGAAVGLKSTSNVHTHLKVLVEKEYIRMDAGQRTISIVHNAASFAPNMINVPIVGAVAAGNPILAVDSGDYDYVPIPAASLRGADENDVFFLEIEGESMVDAGILHGDHILVHKGLTVENGDIGVVRVSSVYGDAATVKRVYRMKDCLRLISENSSMEPIIVPLDGAVIVGKVIGLYRTYR